MPDFPLSAAQIMIAIAVVTAGAAVQGALGFGMALIAAPMLVLIDRALVPGPMIAGGLVLTVLMAHRDRAAIDVHGLSWALVGRFAGTLPAAAALAVVSATAFDLLFGGLVLTGVLLSALGLHMSPTRGHVLLAGALAGFMGTVSSIGGPPIALVYQHSDGPELRGTLAGFFVVGTFVSLAALWAVGLFGVTEIWLSLAIMPGALAGFYLSSHIARRLGDRPVRPLVLGLSFAAGAAVLGRATLALVGG